VCVKQRHEGRETVIFKRQQQDDDDDDDDMVSLIYRGEQLVS